MSLRRGFVVAVLLGAAFAGPRLTAHSGEPTDGAIAVLIARLGNPDASVREAARKELVDLGSEAADALEVAAHDKDTRLADEALAVLGDIGTAARNVGPKLVESAKDLDPGRFVSVARAIGRIDPSAARPVVEEALLRLKSEDASRRAGAATALGFLGAGAQVALPALSIAVSDPTQGIQRESAISIGQIGAAAASARAPVAASTSSAVAGGSPVKETEVAVMWALRWLKNHQSPDGRWDCDGFDATCKLNKCSGPGNAAHDGGVTGLALLSFLGAGETHQSGKCKDNVKNGLKFLRDLQDDDGCFGPRAADRFMYDHACAALALTEAYGMTGSRVLKEPAQRGVGFVLKARNPYLAWRYHVPPDGENDTSVTGWMVMVLKSAVMSELGVDPQAIKDAVAWIDKMTDPESGSCGYQQRRQPVMITDTVAAKAPDEKVRATTAIGVLVRIFAGHTPKDDPSIVKGADLLKTMLPKWDPDAHTVDFYAWHFGALAMFQVGNDFGGHWTAWNDAMKLAIAGHQRMEPDRDERGSWDPIDPWSSEGGRTYATAMNCLTMEVYYRYGRVLAPKRVAEKSAGDQPPVMSTALQSAVAALTFALQSADPELGRAIETSLEQIRTAYRPAEPSKK